MKKLLIASAVAQAFVFGGAEAVDNVKVDYSANTGALSYSFFNLSGNTCTLTPYLGGSNSLASSATPASVFGWNGGSDQTAANSYPGWGFFAGPHPPANPEYKIKN